MSLYGSLVSRAQDSPLQLWTIQRGQRATDQLRSCSVSALTGPIPNHPYPVPRPGFYGNHQDSLESLVLSILCRRERWGSHSL